MNINNRVCAHTDAEVRHSVGARDYGHHFRSNNILRGVHRIRLIDCESELCKCIFISTDTKHEIDIYYSYILHSRNGGGRKAHRTAFSFSSNFSRLLSAPIPFAFVNFFSFLFFCRLFQLPTHLIQMPLLLLLIAFIALMCDDCSVYSFLSSPPSILLNKFSMRKYSIEFAVNREYVRCVSLYCKRVGSWHSECRPGVCVGSSHARDYGDGVEKEFSHLSLFYSNGIWARCTRTETAFDEKSKADVTTRQRK